ncbi:hypothetical protein CPB85DRAFT_1473373, partial [Mucidula mucida]
MSTSRDYYFSTSASYALLTLGVMHSTAGATLIFNISSRDSPVLAFKLCPSLSPRAPEFHRISNPICSQRRSWRSSVDSVATDASGITIDSVSTLFEPDIKRKRRLTVASIGKPIKFAKTTKKEIRPMARRMLDSFTAISATFTTSTTSLFSPASKSYLPRTTSTQVTVAVKKARRNLADVMLFRRKTAAPFVADCLVEDVIEPS